MGNRTQEQVFDPASQLAQTRSRVFNNLNRLFRELGAQSQTTEYAYDDQGNVISVKDPLDRVTSNQYDALNRLRQVTSPAPVSAVTQYAYNGLDALVQVTDPRSLVTGYAVDGLGNLNVQSSPDTGTTTNVLAQRLAELRGLNVITNSLDVALTVARGGLNRVMIAPGTIRAKDNAVIGADVIQWAGSFYYDIAFMGIGAVNLGQGFMDYEEEEAQLRRILVGRTDRSVILADDGKFGRQAFIRTLAFKDVTTLITNEKPPADYGAKFKEAQVDVVF